MSPSGFEREIIPVTGDMKLPYKLERTYDREGRLLSWDEYLDMKYHDPEYRRIGSDMIGDFWVSTVWLGIDHDLSGQGPPLIFETMVFTGPKDPRAADPRPLGEDVYQQRYATEAEARAGHAAVVAALRERISNESDDSGHR